MSSMSGRKCEVCDIAISTRTLFQQSNASTWAPQSLPVIHMCQTCLNDFTPILQKAKSLRSWTALENIDKELVEKVHGLEMQLQFLRLWNSSPMKGNPEGEVMIIATDDGQIFQAHRSMLVAKSSVFKAMLGDGDTRNLMTDMKAEILRPFLHFLYTAELSPEDLEKYSGNLMAAAHMYEIAALKTTCEAYITTHVTEDTAVSFLKLAMDCDSKTIKLAAMKVITKDFKKFVLRDGYQSLKENNPSIIAEALEAMTISAQERTPQNPAAREPSAHNNFVEVATPTAPATATPAGGVFGPATAPLFVHPTAVPFGGSFGSTTPLVTAVPPGGLFGSTTPPVFGNPTAKSSGGFFGQTTQPLFGQPTATPLPGVLGQPTPTPSNDPSSSNHVSSSCGFSSPSHQLLSPQFVFPRAKLDAFARGDSSPPSSSQQSPGFVFPPNLFGAFSPSSHQSPGFLFPSSASSPFGSSSSCQPTGIVLPAVNPCPPAFGEVLKRPPRPVERSTSVKDASANRSWTNRRK